MEVDYCGIDPGLSGGFAVVNGDEILYKLVMPTLSFTTKDGKTKTELDRGGILSFLATLPPHTHVAIEKQEAFRKQNIVSTCTICRNFGILQMALFTAHMFVTEVSPKVWHEYFKISPANEGKGTTKEQAFHIAQRLYPNVDFRKSERSHIVHDGMVDATCLAVYCQSLFAPSPEMSEPLEVKPIAGVKGIVKPLECKPGGKELGAKLKRRRCKFFDQCQIASAQSIICNEKEGRCCGVFRTLSTLQKEKERET